MAESSSSSYGIVFPYLKTFIIVNERTSDHVDKVMVIHQPYATANEPNLTIQDYEDIDIESLLFDDGHPYTTFRMEFTTSHGSLAAARYVDVDEPVLVFDDGTRSHGNISAMRIARLVLWYESLRASGFSAAKILEQCVEISGFVKENEDEEICVICLREYQVGEMIGTLRCKHGYHQECITNWLMQKSECPMCRAIVVHYTV
ncbi:putative chromatin regulator PHD family [Helianthus debilis subsp. tardiflorus]